MTLRMPADAAERLRKLWAEGGPEAEALKAEGLTDIIIQPAEESDVEINSNNDTV